MIRLVSFSSWFLAWWYYFLLYIMFIWYCLFLFSVTAVNAKYSYSDKCYPFTYIDEYCAFPLSQWWIATSVLQLYVDKHGEPHSFDNVVYTNVFGDSSHISYSYYCQYLFESFYYVAMSWHVVLEKMIQLHAICYVTPFSLKSGMRKQMPTLSIIVELHLMESTEISRISVPQYTI